MDETRSKICSEVDSLSDALFDISQYLLDNPETAYQEVKACEHLSGKMDTAIMFHPGNANMPGKDTLGRIKFTMEFHGKTAHAAGSPDQGLNAAKMLALTVYDYLNSEELRKSVTADFNRTA